MSYIHIRNVGPLKDTGKIELTSLMLFIGRQSTGKSTLMKVLCYCSWVEKKVMVDGEDQISKYTRDGRFLKELKSFHRLDDSFFCDESEIFYEGDCVKIELVKGEADAKIVKTDSYAHDRYNTKVCFIPSERNMVSAIKNVNKAYKSSDYDELYNYLWEFEEAKTRIDRSRQVEMPFDRGIAYYYDSKEEKDMVFLKPLQRSMETIYASSGVQSAMPIMVLLEYLISVVGAKRALSPKEIQNAVAKMVLYSEMKDVSLSDMDFSKLSQLLNYSNCQLYIEELEQNLFPQSQYDMLMAVVKGIKVMSNMTEKRSRVVMTTHSPYVLTSLNLLMKAAKAYETSPNRVKSVVAEDYILPIAEFSAYWISDGKLNDIIDREYGFIAGDHLDMISEFLSAKTEELNDIIYG